MGMKKQAKLKCPQENEISEYEGPFVCFTGEMECDE
jgi:hypothetical protein